MEKKCVDKKKQIIEVAQKRFALYGFDKTTMQEIADDLEMSKGSLYYYFTDKESLYKSIIAQEKKEFLQILRLKVNQLDDPKTMLHEYTRIRMKLSERLINLARAKSLFHKNLQTFMKGAVSDLLEQEDLIIREIFRAGIEKGLFKISDLGETAALFNDLVRGIRMLFLRDKHTFQQDTDWHDYEEKMTLFVEIFCKGLSVE